MRDKIMTNHATEVDKEEEMDIVMPLSDLMNS